MANRYWVGGTASWDGTAGTKWAATSGGAGGETVPTTADDVFLDANSGASTITITTGNTGAKSINCTGFTGTLTNNASITVAGSVTLVSGMTFTQAAVPSNVFTFTGSGTLTTAGKTFSGITINGSGINVILLDALNIGSRTITVTQGTFYTSNFNVTAGALVSTSTSTRVINLGSSTITITSPFNIANITNLTFIAGTSQINLTGPSAEFRGGGATYYNVSFTNTTTGSPRSITGANTFNNLTLNASAAGITQLFIGSNQTVNGTFTCAGSASAQRGFVRSDTIGTTRTITAASISANDCDFRDITIAGAAAGSAPTRAGDCGGNSGISFPAPKTVYRVGTGTSWDSSTSWALTSGGTGNNNNFPLAQDTAVIDNNTALTETLAINRLGWNIGALDCSTRTTAITLNHNAISNRYGSYTLGSGVTVSGKEAQTFSGIGTMTFTSVGKTITFPITVDTPSGTFQFGDAFSSSNTILHIRGTFDAVSYNVTAGVVASNSGLTRTLNMGSGLWTLSGTNPWNLGSAGITFNKQTANILLTNQSTTQKTFTGGGLSYNKVTIGGSLGIAVYNFTGANSFAELESTKSSAFTVRFGENQGVITTWAISGSSGNVVTVDSSTAGTRRNFTLTNVTSGINYLSVKDIGELSGNKFYVGANSTNGGNNSNVYFTVPPAPPTNTFGMLLMF